ncbi:MAG: hypothetical protein QG576_166 [Bacteroidota bacterium]|nr:hypothetical protein [Bacteroidota bacterium]
MEKTSFPIFILAALLSASGCTGKGPGKKNLKAEMDTIAVPDTGYTGIKKFMSGEYLVMEVTFKNGVRDGLMKSFYKGGQVRQTYWYENGLKEDSVRWYYQEGQLFRSSPYKHDTIDGIQKQYYRTGKLKAKIGYRKGLRTAYFEEFTPEGRLVKGYPELVVDIRDEYSINGLYHIGLELTDKSPKVKFYRGDFMDGRFDTAKYKIIKTIQGKGTIDLKKTGTPKPEYVGVIAEILTPFGNRLLTWKKIELPYKDLN